ncbi:2-amino-4-hydroxy-6-hydroxymethyldihydropteridinediphosphokinase [Atopomonas hussainii]|uniref:2-amino-4-hydroxy-6-hydroxymethyldihydropteridine pyrophosphokinase n=1 Tax=Atopomonas hussainii TaxID=1429083 RepID=A0A1H7IPK6_9GAMM|nr:2-amino-4-hydroxy-6-hydroxymethyldihydropteridine diphosphokinase [Atopomonas hussainii]SEK64234.1 2-amino-4-hydroxy-6-hydroxymethyldihydropteridinediphosphokinase [Atopomonas hussainii]
MACVYIGLGSNLAEPRQQLQNALSALMQTDGISHVECSPLYISDPLGPADQPRYVNAVARLTTTLAPLELLDVLQRIEQEQGRVRKEQRWGPRTLDLDILLYDQQCIDEPRLTVPHYHMQARAFVLYPLADLAPELLLPDGQSLQTLLQHCPFIGLERLDNSAVLPHCTKT